MTIILLREPIIHIYSQTPVVVELASEAFFFYGIAFFFDWTQCYLSGLIKAVKKQGIASVCSLCCMIFVSLPTGYCCGFKLDLGLKGFWMGYGLSSLCLASIYSFIMLRVSWSETAHKASQCNKDASFSA